MSAKVVIRHATIKDIPEIVAMIKELAIYEKALDMCKVTEELMIRNFGFEKKADGSTSERFARAFVLEEDGKMAGMAVYYYNFATWTAKPGIYLEDLFIRPEFRKKGYGTAMLAALAKEVIQMDGGRLDWQVLDWNKPSIDLYKSIGAKAMSEWLGMRVDGEGLDHLSKLGPKVDREE